MHLWYWLKTLFNVHFDKRKQHKPSALMSSYKLKPCEVQMTTGRACDSDILPGETFFALNSFNHTSCPSAKYTELRYKDIRKTSGILTFTFFSKFLKSVPWWINHSIVRFDTLYLCFTGISHVTFYKSTRKRNMSWYIAMKV